jgi:hypothetical protein
MKQGGQAMTEFAVGVSAFSLLAVGTLTIAGFQEAQRRAIAGARHAAFESAWRNGRTATIAPAEQVFRTHFDDYGFVRQLPEERWITSSNVRIADSDQEAPGHASTAATLFLAPLRLAGGFLGGGFDLANSGYRTVMLSVDLPASRRLPDPFPRLELTLSQPMTLLSDAWNAGGSSHVLERTAGLVPTHSLAALSSLWRPVATPLALIEPGIDELCLGLIEPEDVPEDRLGPVVLHSPAHDDCR